MVFAGRCKQGSLLNTVVQLSTTGLLVAHSSTNHCKFTAGLIIKSGKIMKTELWERTIVHDQLCTTTLHVRTYQLSIN